MSFPEGTLALAWLAAGWAALGLLAVWWWRSARPARLGAFNPNLWLATWALVAALWPVRAGVDPGFMPHLVGAAALYLMIGASLAIAGIGLVALVAAALGAGGWQVLLDGALPVGVVHLARRALERRVPPNPFVYIIGIAYFASGCRSPRSPSRARCCSPRSGITLSAI
ncbi:MAG TPA: energy-coupling factor ABC transporter permease [Burkholderiales bacterium]|nr:energy-coupling factor ABC transporter permease [Burkholderiales bacterium]